MQGDVEVETWLIEHVLLRSSYKRSVSESIKFVLAAEMYTQLLASDWGLLYCIVEGEETKQSRACLERSRTAFFFVPSC